MKKTDKKIMLRSKNGKFYILYREKGLIWGYNWCTWCFAGMTRYFDTPEQAEESWNDEQKDIKPDTLVKYF